jgi:hypothetical protein
MKKVFLSDIEQPSGQCEPWSIGQSVSSLLATAQSSFMG